MPKSRLSVLDCRRLVNDLQAKVKGMWLHNVYDITAKTFQFKLSLPEKGKVSLLVEAGVRFHTTQYVRQMPDFPSGFAMKLRKHIRGKRLNEISQIGYDRVIMFTFGFKEKANHVIIELYASGNVVLTDANFSILSVLRTHVFDDVADARVAVGSKYPFNTATTELQPCSSADVLKSIEKALEDSKERRISEAETKRMSKKKTKPTLKSTYLYKVYRCMFIFL